MSLFGGIELPDRPDPENVRRLDLLQIPMIREMQRFGIRIDPEHFRALSARLNTRMRELKTEITSEIPPESLDRFIELSDFSELENPDDDS